MRIEFVDGGEIVSTHGVRGEIKVLPWVDSPDSLCGIKRFRIDNTEYKVTSCRVQKTCNLIKLSGVDTVEQAQLLRGKTIRVYREDFPEDLIFADELMDIDVYSDGENIGKITNVLDYPGNKVYVVSGEREYMIPAVKAFILTTDLDNNRMDVKLIEGMATDES